MATDPVERFEMIRDSILDAGLSFENMSYYQRLFYTESLGLNDVNELSLLLSGNMNEFSNAINANAESLEEQQKAAKLVMSVHDVSLGGIMIGALKMCIAGSKGIKFYKFKNLTNIYQYFFSEDQGRYIIEVEKNNLKKVESILKKNSVHFDLLGETTDKEIIINDEPTFTVDKVTEFYKGWLYKYMS